MENQASAALIAPPGTGPSAGSLAEKVSSLSSLQRERLKLNWEAVVQRIRTAESAARRKEGSCRLLAVVKNQPDEVVEALLELGQHDVAENRVQPLLQRPEALRTRARFHLVGPLQSNKVKKAAPWIHSFHGLDSLRLANLLDAEMAVKGRVLEVFLQINISGEQNKHGCPLGLASTLAVGVQRHAHLKVIGLMGMAAISEDPGDSRPAFQRLAELASEMQRQNVLPEDARELSMGMSNDLEPAVEEGATVVRVGSALFAGLKTASVHDPEDSAEGPDS